MRSAIFKTFVITAIFLVSSHAVFGQTTSGESLRSAQTLIGETLKYDAKVNKILRGISVAELTLTAANAANHSDLVIKAEAVSKGTLLKIFRYSFLQQYESTVDAAFRILKTTKHDVQKDRIRDSEAIFDYGQRRVTFMETDPKSRMRPPRSIASEIGSQMLDMVSAIYYIRLSQLAVGKRFDLSVSDSGIVYKVPFAVTGREMQKTILGNVWCFRVEPEIFGPGRLIEQKGKMVMWITDDDRHTPVRSQIDSSVGKIDIKLKSTMQAK